MLTNREKSDLEVIYRLFGVDRLIYEEEDGVFFAKSMKTEIPSFVVLNKNDFPSLERKINSIKFLLEND